MLCVIKTSWKKRQMTNLLTYILNLTRIKACFPSWSWLSNPFTKQKSAWQLFRQIVSFQGGTILSWCSQRMILTNIAFFSRVLSWSSLRCLPSRGCRQKRSLHQVCSAERKFLKILSVKLFQKRLNDKPVKSCHWPKHAFLSLRPTVSKIHLQH